MLHFDKTNNILRHLFLFYINSKINRKKNKRIFNFSTKKNWLVKPKTKVIQKPNPISFKKTKSSQFQNLKSEIISLGLILPQSPHILGPIIYWYLNLYMIVDIDVYIFYLNFWIRYQTRYPKMLLVQENYISNIIGL